MKDHEEGWELRPGQLVYPEKLADLKVGNDERLPTLYAIGDPACLELPIVAVLGSRVASKDALLAAQASSLVAGSIGAAVMTEGAMGVGAEALRKDVETARSSQEGKGEDTIPAVGMPEPSPYDVHDHEDR